VLRGIEGFGASSAIHTTRLLSLAENLPAVILIAVQRECQAGNGEGQKKNGQDALPLHRKLTMSPSAASKVLVRLEFRPLRSFTKMASGGTLPSCGTTRRVRRPGRQARHDVVRAVAR
jgi:hypothetical protein